MQYEAPTQAGRAVRGRVLEPSVLVETLLLAELVSPSVLGPGIRIATVVTGFVDRGLQGFGTVQTEHTLVTHRVQRGEKLDKS